MRKNVILFSFLFALFFMSCKSEESNVWEIQTNMGNIKVKLYDETPIHKDNFVKLVNEGFYDGILFHRVINSFMIQAGDPDSKNAAPNNILGANGADYKLDAEILPQFFHKRGVLAAARESDIVNPERKSSGSHFYIVQGRRYSEEELNVHINSINDNRRTAIFERLKSKYEGDINKYTSEENFDTLMEINEKISEETALIWEKEKLVLTEEQKQAYTTVGGTPHLDGQYTIFGEVVEGMDVVDKISFVETDPYSRPLKDVKIIKIKNVK